MSKTHESLKLLPTLWLGPIQDRSHLLGVHPHLTLGDDVAEKRDVEKVEAWNSYFSGGLGEHAGCALLNPGKKMSISSR